MLPSLEDVVSRFRSRAFLYIELKVAGLEDAVVRTLCANSPERGYVVASFLPEVLDSTRRREANLPLGLICRNARGLARWPDLPLDYVMPRHSLVSRALVDELHAAGKRVIVWTVNRERDVRKMVEFGVDGIVSDDTLLLGRTVGSLR